jgi:hypothetical protein
VILFTAECSQSFSIKQIHNPGHNLKCSAVKKIQRFSSKENLKVQKQTDNFKGSAVNKIQRFSSKQIHNPEHNLKGSAVKKIQRFSSNR